MLIECVQEAKARLEEEERKQEEATKPPAWWEAGDFACAQDSDDEDDTDEMQRPYLRVVVQAITRSHDGYCSGIDEDEDGQPVCCYNGEPAEIEEHSYLMTGFLPLKDPRGVSWNFQVPDLTLAGAAPRAAAVSAVSGPLSASCP